MDATGEAEREHRYILITQCLQNDLFFSDECRLGLPRRSVAEMVLPRADADAWVQKPSREHIERKRLDAGPLGQFLRATIGEGLKGKRETGPLHVINIRDWHEPSEAYDLERRAYGPHCEPGTVGAAYLTGLERYLDPRGSPAGDKAHFFHKGDVRIYHVHSQSVFDFKPQSGQPDTSEAKHVPSQLEQLLDILIQGTDDDIESLARPMGPNTNWRALHDLADAVNARHPEGGTPLAYVAVIGAYTDIKVLTLLAGIRTRYEVRNLAVSDTLTASATLDRHLNGLDFAAKVLGVDVIHGLNELIRYLGGSPTVRNEGDLIATAPYARYETFFQDKQHVLAYQDEKLREYLFLTERRSVDVYERIKRANQFLIWFGSFFLILTLLGAVLAAIFPDPFDWKLPLVTGSVSLLQLIGAFYTKPIHDLQQNLTNLAQFKMILESHSLKTAFARFHLTTPLTLREVQSRTEAEDGTRQVTAFRELIDAIQAYDKADFASLTKLAFSQWSDGGGNGHGAPATGAPKPTEVHAEPSQVGIGEAAGKPAG